MRLFENISSDFKIEMMPTRFYDKNGDAKPFDININGAKAIYIKDDNELKWYFICENKVFKLLKIQYWIGNIFKYGEVIYELNEIDAVYWMSDCINIEDKVYEIVDREENSIYIKELDLA